MSERNSTRRQFIKNLGAAVAFGGALVSLQDARSDVGARRRPNVIVIQPDQLGAASRNVVQVVLAHGFVDANESLTMPQKDNVAEIRDAVVELGFAWAYCSYRENGMAVKDGAWATRQLTRIFTARVKAQPT